MLCAGTQHMTRVTASLSRVVSSFWRHDRNSQRPPLWLASIAAVGGAVISAVAMKLDWRLLADNPGFAFLPSSTMLACGGLALFVGGITALSPVSRRKIGAWLLIGVAALGVALASDVAMNFDQSKQVSSNNVMPDARAAHQRARKILFLKAAQEKPAADLTSKFVMLILLGAGIGLVRRSTLVREAGDARPHALFI